MRSMFTQTCWLGRRAFAVTRKHRVREIVLCWHSFFITHEVKITKHIHLSLLRDGSHVVTVWICLDPPPLHTAHCPQVTSLSTAGLACASRVFVLQCSHRLYVIYMIAEPHDNFTVNGLDTICKITAPATTSNGRLYAFPI